MEQTRAQKKAELQKAAEALIEQLLDWDEATKRPNLTQIEDEVLAIRQEFSQALTAVVVESQGAQQPALEEQCPTCGGALRYKGQKRKKVETRVGTVEIQRGYYYCPQCKKGVFPPGPATGIE